VSKKPPEWTELVSALEQKHARKVCGAKKRNGQPCPTTPMPNGKCRMHGGKSPSGAAHPAYVHGRYVGQRALHGKSLPASLAQVFHEALADEDLVALREQLALANARLAELLAGIRDTAGTADQWAAIGRIIERHTEQQAKGGKPDPAAALDAIAEALKGAQGNDRAHRQVAEQQELIRRLADTEVKRLKAASEAISRDKAIALAGALILAVREAVGSPEAVAAVQRRFAELVPGLLARGIPGGGE
jgi:hypothetical protein